MGRDGHSAYAPGCLVGAVVQIPKSHPRYESLMTRELLVQGVKDGLVVPEGLLAHGRGEAFDYLLGETTQPFALMASRAAAAHFLLARNPVISVNGNTGVLAAESIAGLQKLTGAKVEVNIFHRTEERVERLVAHLESHGCEGVLGRTPDAAIPGLDHARAKCTQDGIFTADVVLVPLEDGDRCEALVAMGKTVIVVDLNPLSRTARKGSVTLVDNVVRAIPSVARAFQHMRTADTAVWTKEVEAFDNRQNLASSLTFIAERLAADSIL